MRFKTPSELTSEIADRIVSDLRAKNLEMIDTGLSNVSCSAYVSFENDDGEEYCIRISDHEARTYNRDGDFRIGVGTNGDDHITVNIQECYERAIIEPIKWDDEGEPIEFDTVGYEPCREDDDDSEFAAWEADDEQIDSAVRMAVEFAVSRSAAKLAA